MHNGDDPDDPLPPYTRHPPRDPPLPPPPVYPLLTAPSFRLSDNPIFPLTAMSDPDVRNLNAHRELEYHEFIRPPGRRIHQTHYAIIIGSRLGVTANLETARATQVNVSGGWIQECVSYWQAIWVYRVHQTAGRTSLRFRGNSPSSTAYFDRIQQSASSSTVTHSPSSTATRSAPSTAAPSSTGERASLSTAITNVHSSTSAGRGATHVVATAGSSRSVNATTRKTTATPKVNFPVVVVPTERLFHMSNQSAPPLLQAALRVDTRKANKRALDAPSSSRPNKTPRYTEVIDLTLYDEVIDLTADDSDNEPTGDRNDDDEEEVEVLNHLTCKGKGRAL